MREKTNVMRPVRLSRPVLMSGLIHGLNMAQRYRVVVFVCGLVLLLSGVASAFSGRTPSRIAGASMSPGGSQIARSQTLPYLGGRRPRQRIIFNDELGSPFGAIDSIGLDGKGLRRLVAGASDAAISPDGTKIAYWGEPYGCCGGIFVMRADGSHIRWLDHEGERIDSQPAWSPDGRKLVFTSTISPAPSGALFASSLYTMDADGSALRLLAPSAVDSPGPSWIDAQHILITAARGRFAVISASNGRVQRWIDAPAKGVEPAADPPALAPNRRVLAYVECYDAGCHSTAVDLISLGGRLIRRIGGARTPSWSPNGDLLYACCQEAGIRGNTSRIMLAPAGGGPVRTITPISLSAGQPVSLG